ncbi:hypothetical protein JVU11DRAFT_11927 [Chiua virens]|nr:hypothetical protein JVU11DRAFT_11927 [Chiua virens]
MGPFNHVQCYEIAAMDRTKTTLPQIPVLPSLLCFNVSLPFFLLSHPACKHVHSVVDVSSLRARTLGSVPQFLCIEDCVYPSSNADWRSFAAEWRVVCISGYFALPQQEPCLWFRSISLHLLHRLLRKQELLKLQPPFIKTQDTGNTEFHPFHTNMLQMATRRSAHIQQLPEHSKPYLPKRPRQAGHALPPEMQADPIHTTDAEEGPERPLDTLQKCAEGKDTISFDAIM